MFIQWWISIYYIQDGSAVCLMCTFVMVCSARILRPECGLLDCMERDCMDTYRLPDRYCPICRPNTPKTCKVDGVTYKEGERLPSHRCRICRCENGSVVCLDLPCMPSPDELPLP
ncbi:hypothetical protein DPMN_128222 [Dreissena polymorpha]|uniref:VWFC domain-containing protein n=1 Tax=Dreissena polymorpha TaxID=45954 RepID=A0A9D4H6Q2_DREPO|nr:hypothetical protein DPMN_128222 [Dreissena polymorpha]